MRQSTDLLTRDLHRPNAPKYLLAVALTAFWLIYTEGNVILAIAAYTMYNRFVKRDAAAAAAGGAPAVGAATGAATAGRFAPVN